MWLNSIEVIMKGWIGIWPEEQQERKQWDIWAWNFHVLWKESNGWTPCNIWEEEMEDKHWVWWICWTIIAFNII